MYNLTLKKPTETKTPSAAGYRFVAVCVHTVQLCTFQTTIGFPGENSFISSLVELLSSCVTVLGCFRAWEQWCDWLSACFLITLLSIFHFTQPFCSCTKSGPLICMACGICQLMILLLITVRIVSKFVWVRLVDYPKQRHIFQNLGKSAQHYLLGLM